MKRKKMLPRNTTYKLAGLAMLCTLFSCVEPSEAEGVTFKLMHSGSCLDVMGARDADGTPLIQDECHGREHQRWTLNEVSDDTYQIISDDSEKCIGVNPDDDVVALATCESEDARTFKFRRKTRSFYSIQDTSSGLCLEVEDGSREDFEQIVQTRCSNRKSQLFKVPRRAFRNATQAPVTPPPAEEEPPVEQPPVDQPPVDQPPVDQPPVEQPPVDQTRCPADAIKVSVGTNIQALVASRPEGSKFCLESGIHRMQSVDPKPDMQFFGETGATMNGSRLLTSFSREGSLYFVTGQTQQGLRRDIDECLEDRPRCMYPEAFFINDQPLIAVDAKSKVTTGKFFFDYGADRIYFLDNPQGKKVETSVSPYAFIGRSPGVDIQGLIVEKYSTPIQYSAIGYNIPGENWVVRNNEIRLNYAVGAVVGSGSIMIGNNTHHNGEMGFSCNGDNIVLENNEIAHNGYFSGLDPFWEGGGVKCAVTRNLTFRGNYSHHNNGVGLWADIDNIDTLYEGNRIEYNMDAGISHEISYDAIIRNNTFKENGLRNIGWLWGAQIQIQNSQNVEVYDNEIVAMEGGHAFGIINQDRGSGLFGPYEGRNNYFHHNTVVCDTSKGCGLGMVTDDGTDLLSAGNRMDYNNYQVTSTTDDFVFWPEPITFSELRNEFRQELNSTIREIP